MKQSRRNPQVCVIFFSSPASPQHVVIVFPRSRVAPKKPDPPRHKAPTVLAPMLSGGAGRVHAVRQHLSSGGPGLWDETRLFLLPQHATALRPSWGGLKMQHLLCLFIFHGEAPALADTILHQALLSIPYESQHCHKHLLAPHGLLAGGELVISTADFCFEGKKK